MTISLSLIESPYGPLEMGREGESWYSVFLRLSLNASIIHQCLMIGSIPNRRE